MAEAWATWFAQVAIEPTLLYENSYEPIPGYIPKAPTATQVPTEIRGAVAMTIFNAGQSLIEVGVLQAEMPLVVKLQNRLLGFAEMMLPAYHRWMELCKLCISQ